MLIINADDWGRSQPETDAAFACYKNGRITSVTAMMFMQDSERAAELAHKAGVPVGLHLNLSEPFTAQRLPAGLVESHRRVSKHLKRNRYAFLIYNPMLRKDFRLLYHAQAEEFERLYGKAPTHVDGHQHLHLCANVLLDRVIPRARKVRRNLSFCRGEKSFLNRTFRRMSDACVGIRYKSTDYFFCLSTALANDGLNRVAQLARSALVELMVHPIRAHEYAWLLSECCPETLSDIQTGSYASF